MVRKFVSVKSRSYKKANWSHENKGCNVELSSSLINTLYQGGSIIVPAVTGQGTRTVGNWSITVPVASTAAVELFWALVYVPQGTNANNLFATTGSVEGSLYEPNQYVLASGISDNSSGPIRIRSRMLRKLHSGDFISLIIGSTSGTAIAGTVSKALVSYSIKYN